MEDRRHPRRANHDPAGSGAAQPAEIAHRAAAGFRRAPLPTRAQRSAPARRAARPPLPLEAEDLPALPRTYDEALDTGLAALDIGLDPEGRTAIATHVRLLLAWNTAINLTAITDPAAVAVRHVLDSLSAVPLLHSRGINRLLEIGSGGGFPGIPLVAAVPLQQALLIESIGKKAAFLTAAARATGLAERVVVAAERAEAVAGRSAERDRWPAVVARAVAPLGELVELAFPLLRPGGLLIAWKRGEIEAELAGAKRAAIALGGGTLEVVGTCLPQLADHRLVIVTRRAQTVPAAFPRAPRRRAAAPW